MIGVQLPGNVQIGTFVQQINAESTAKIVANVRDTLQSHDEAYQRSFDEHPAVVAAQRGAQRMCDIGRAEDASQVFIDALEREARAERERQEAHKRLRLRFLEEAVLSDQRAFTTEAAFGKLRQIAEIVHPGDQKAQAQYLFGRARKYQEIGKTKGDNSALLVAIAAFSWLAKDMVDVERT